MKIKITIMVLAAISIVAIAGMALFSSNRSQPPAPGGADSSKSESKTREIVDAGGKKITIPAKVERIAAAGALNQIVFMLGGGGKLVATAEGVQKGFFTTVFPRIKELPAAYAGAGPGTLNMETLLKANPQVVFGSYVNDKDVKTLASAGIALFGLKLNTPQDIKDTVSMVGKIIGPEAEQKAAAFNRYYDQNLDYARQTTAAAAKIKVFAASSDGGSGPIGTVPANDILTSYIEAAGGINIVAEKLPTTLADGSASVDFEFLISRQPEVIVAQNRQIYDYITDPKNGSQWQYLDAVKNKKVYLNPKGVYLWSVRSAEGALEPLWLAEILHPELTADLDMEQKMKEFYRDNYYYELSDAQVENILFPEN
ncbi:MAG: ABC transporter substrate-binding protein [Candidatus Yanofskyibacterium parasiticum]|nr:MAG: ABC transporter substrate-binding protein [Candidatus Yanofskybacteria bacterium]